ncbi:hypothetical protein ES705_03486 [subsurface metagenome]|nr:hypothetical protein [Methanosarcinales archaeon]
MNGIVYLLGAGVNQAIKDFDNQKPPLITNLLQIALKKKKYSDAHYTNRIQVVYDYIEKYWKKTKSDLANAPFDLEQCFTLLERQKEEACRKDQEEYKRLVAIEFRLKSFLAEVLSDFEYSGFNLSMYNFGRILVHEHPTILTFNYDCIIESIIESASGVNPSIPRPFHDRTPSEDFEIPDELLAYSHSNWNRPLGYGITFDEVQLYQAGVSKYVDGKRFYSHPQNKLYSWPILKLHGSLNWFKYLPVRSFPTFPGEEQPTLGEKEHEIILVQGHWWFNEPPDHHGWYIDPIIITPTLYKDKYFREPPFKQIWEMAKNALSRCKRLVVIGYSFSPSDFSTKQLLLEAFSNNDLEGLIVVNPDVNIVQLVKDLCHFDGGVVWYRDLEEYIRAFSKTELGANIMIKGQSLKVAQEDIPTDTTPHDLYVKCKTCGVEFPVGIRTNPQSFATSIYVGNIHQCPEGHAHPYDKEDYILKKAVR